MTSTLAIAAALLAAIPAVAAVAEAPSLSRGSWIWTAGPADPQNLHAYFRKTLDLASVPATAVVRVTADTRYVLYVNGKRVCRGPARSHSRWLAYDVADIAPYLRPGRNAICALVHHYGVQTFRTQAGRAGFLLEADISDGAKSVAVQTDGTWKCLPSEAWDRTVGKMGLQLDFPEVFDARKEPVGWRAADFDDAAWPAATVLGPAGMAPWTDLSLSDIPRPSESIVRPAAVTDVMAVRVPPPAAFLDFLPMFDRKGWAVVYAATWVHAPKEADVTLEAGFDDVGKLWLDGRLVLEQRAAAAASPALVSAKAHLSPGWHILMAKTVQVAGRWACYLGVSGDPSVVYSSTKDAAKPGTWLVSQPFAFDASKGIASGLDEAFAPEKAGIGKDWKPLEAPIGPVKSVATLMRSEKIDPSAPARVSDPSNLTIGEARAAFQSGNGEDGAVLLDMGREVFGYPRITIRGAQGGEVVDMGYGEALEGPDGAYVSPKGAVKGRLNPDHQDVTYADRFICRPGDNTFETLEKRAFRYWQIDVRTAGKPVTVSEATVALSTYPVVYRGSFECSDPVLNRIWDMGRWTVQLNMDDAYTDCPWRERAQWWGDVRVEALVNYYAFGDSALMRRALLQAAQSQDAEGIVHGVFPTDWDGARLPSFSLIWVYSLWEYYLYTGDDSLFPKVMPVIDRLMAFFQPRIDPKFNLLSEVPYWVFIDWAPGMDVQRRGISATLNCLYYQALTAASRIAAKMADAPKSADYAARAKAVRDAINGPLWSPNLKTYFDGIWGIPNGILSQHVSSLVIGFGIAPKDRWESTMRVTNAYEKTVRIGSPYFGAYYLDALYAMDRHQEALDYIRKHWGAMLDWGATTCWEKWEPTDSLCHGWSACPTRDLPAQYLGVRPVTPGWAEWEMAPALCDLKWTKGTVPTPHGDIKASWTRQGAGATFNITVPEGTSAHFRAPASGLEGAVWKVNGRSTLPSYVKLESTNGRWGVALTKPGDYVIVAAPPAS